MPKAPLATRAPGIGKAPTIGAANPVNLDITFLFFTNFLTFLKAFLKNFPILLKIPLPSIIPA